MPVLAFKTLAFFFNRHIALTWSFSPQLKQCLVDTLSFLSFTVFFSLLLSLKLPLFLRFTHSRRSPYDDVDDEIAFLRISSKACSIFYRVVKPWTLTKSRRFVSGIPSMMHSIISSSFTSIRGDYHLFVDVIMERSHGTTHLSSTFVF